METKLRINAYDISKLRILVVDDSRSMRHLVCHILRQLNVMSVSQADSGEAAIGLLRGGMFDAMILDWVMRGMDGLELTNAIRGDLQGVDRYMPIIMLTGRNGIGDVVAARDAGVHEYISKPVSVQALYARIVSVIENPRPFVTTESFNGPDRRRQADASYQGDDRRGKRRSRLSKKADAAMDSYKVKLG